VLVDDAGPDPGPVALHPLAAAARTRLSPWWPSLAG